MSTTLYLFYHDNSIDFIILSGKVKLHAYFFISC